MAVPAVAGTDKGRSQRSAHAVSDSKAKDSNKSKKAKKADKAEGESSARRATSSSATSSGQGRSASTAKSSNRSSRAKAAKTTDDSRAAKAGNPSAAEQRESGEAKTAGENSPAGNKGSMKVRPVGTPAQPPRNYAHLPCVVQVDFYGSPHAGATLTAVSHAPTAPTGRTLLTEAMTFDQSSPNPRGNELVGTTTLDFTSVVDGLSYHEQQGYHVKLTAVQDGPRGGDVKHKVFWIDCGAPAAAEDAVDGDAEVSASGPGGEEIDMVGSTVMGSQVEVEGASADGEVVGLSGGAEDTEVAGVMVVRDEEIAGVGGRLLGQAGDEGVRGARVLAATGIGLLALALLGLVGLGGGAGMLRRFRKRP
jgi:hypothetical protein